MKITLLTVGKTSEKYLLTGMNEYQKRLSRYGDFQLQEIPDLKKSNKLSQGEVKNQEGDLILKQIKDNDFVILLDDKGKEYSSIQMADRLNHWLQGSHKRILFIIGGAYGFSDAIYQRANHKLSLSQLTFNHQMIRLFFIEQIYRCFTILKGEKYHHE